MAARGARRAPHTQASDVPPIDPLTDAWLEAERAAVRAELEVEKLGQATADPTTAELFLRAEALREEADRLFREVQKMLGQRTGKPGG